VKLPLPKPSARLAVTALGLCGALAGTLVAVVPAGAAPVASVTPQSPALATPAPATTPVPPTTPAPAATTRTPSATASRAATATAARPRPSAPTATRRATVRPAPRPAPARVVRSVPRPQPTGVRRTPTSWTALNGAIARIPGYANGAPVHWVVTGSFGHLGMTNWYTDTIYLSPSIPTWQLDAVARHEYGHILEARAYGGDIPRMITALNRVFGGGGRGNLNGAEMAADCIALVNGANWTHYTSCANPTWRAAARRIIAGRPV
jgi:hypothetical protein